MAKRKKKPRKSDYLFQEGSGLTSSESNLGKKFQEQQEFSTISEVLMGDISQRGPDSTETKSANVIMSNARAVREIVGDWANTAVMSLDGLLRPVAKYKGDSNLPPYASDNPGSNNAAPDGAQPPLRS